jgi:hypothetical protein
MNHFRNKFFLTLTLLAASIFLSVSLGGEFLHKNIHHHQDTASQDECPVSHLLAQLFLFVVAAVFVVQKVNISSIVPANEIFIFPNKFLFPSLRAPPISL